VLAPEEVCGQPPATPWPSLLGVGSLLASVLGRGFVVISGVPSINQFTIVAEDAIPVRSCSGINDGKQMLTYALCFFEIHAAADHPVKNQRALVAEFKNFDRERQFIGHSLNKRLQWLRSSRNRLTQSKLTNYTHSHRGSQQIVVGLQPW